MIVKKLKNINLTQGKTRQEKTIESNKGCRQTLE